MSYPKQLLGELVWEEYAISDSSDGLVGPAPARDEYPAYVIMNELAMSGKAGRPGESVHVRLSDLMAYTALEDRSYSRIFYDLGLPDPYEGPVYLEATGALATLGFQIGILFPESVSKFGPSGNRELVRDGMFLVNPRKNLKYSCTPGLFALYGQLDLLCEYTHNGRPREDTLLVFSRIKKEAEGIGAYFDDVIASERVSEAGRISLKVTDENGSVSIKPDIDVEGQPSGTFSSKFDKRFGVDSVYNLDTPEGRERLVLSSAQKKAIAKLKNEYQRISDPQKLLDLRKNPPAEFDEIDIDVSEIYGELYSDRVKGLGVYRPKTWPFICPYETEWLPGIMVEGIDGKKTILIRNPKELEELDNAINTAAGLGKDYADFNGERIDLDTARSAAHAARERFSGKPISAQEASAHLKILLIKENVDSLEYSEAGKADELQEVECTYRGLDPSLKLKEYQEKGVSQLASLYSAGFPGAILADDMGLGKTLQALCFLEWLGERKEGVVACIVCPVGLIGNWIEEYRKCFPDGELLLKSVMHDMHLVCDLRSNREKFQNAVFLMSYEALRRNQLDVCSVRWDVAILDEAQKIKTPGTLVTNAAKALNARFKVALTGTPVENTFHDLWCIADFCMPGYLGSARSFADEYNASKDDTDAEIMMKGGKLLDRLGRRFIRRTKDNVLKDLPPKFESDNPEHADKFRSCPTAMIMPESQRQVYNNILVDYRTRKEHGELEGKRGILDVLHNLKRTCEHPSFANLPMDQGIEYNYDDSAKVISLIGILDRIRNANEKAIIFAEYRQTQRYIAALVHERYGIYPPVINGDTPTGTDPGTSSVTRLGIVKRFNHQEGFSVIVMSPIAAGVGLTVTGANHVIHFSRHWNPSKEDQATDRAYRIGQEKPVFVYYLVAKHPDSRIKSFDENLANLLRAKRNLRGAVLYPSERMEIHPEDMLKEVEETPVE